VKQPTFTMNHRECKVGITDISVESKNQKKEKKKSRTAMVKASE